MIPTIVSFYNFFLIFNLQKLWENIKIEYKETKKYWLEENNKL